MRKRNPVVVSELLRIAEAHRGVLKPEDVVEAARPKTSPLHDKFDWDNNEAGPKYRLWQARQLISVTVEYIGGGKDQKPYRVFVSLTPDRHDDGGYRTIEAVMSEPGSRRQLLEDALEEMERFQRKYADLKELATVFAEMKKVTAKRQRRVAA